MRNLRDYAVITASYWTFTLTDGALRMLILFHLHELGFSPLKVVSLFVFYEFFGVVTNLVGGWLGARFGLRNTLFTGLGLQIIACSLLALMSAQLSVPLVMLAQAISGIAKDLTKMSSKSYIKFVVPSSDGAGLMKWVAILTGSKNALKGVGFLLGGFLLGSVGFQAANLGMAGMLLLMLLLSWMLLPNAAGKSKSKLRLRQMIPSDARINWLSAARLFLFGSRDVWFVFALPIFLSTNLGWSFARSGAFLAAWVIGYGMVQALTPLLVGGRDDTGQPPSAKRLIPWTIALLLPLGGLAALLHQGAQPAASLIAGLALFGIIFAINSAMHSFLIVHYADDDQVSLNVGFYYMANSLGRLLGTVLSGAVFQWAGMGSSGLVACLLVSAGLVLASSLFCLPLKSAEARMSRAPEG